MFCVAPDITEMQSRAGFVPAARCSGAVSLGDRCSEPLSPFGRCSPCQTADLAMTGIYLSYLLQRVELLTYFPNFCILIIIQRRLFSITRG